MRTILSGPVTDGHLATAELFGIEPTSFVTTMPTHHQPNTVLPVDKMLGHLGENARNYTLCQNADALVCIGGNEHLVRVARQYGLTVFEDRA